MTTIPDWNIHGVLPPNSATNPTGYGRSPYAVSLAEVVLRFGTSPERRLILDGLIRFRAELHRVGLTDGFQWLDGSFLENVEESDENRAPRDVDVVSFFNVPDECWPTSDDLALFDPDATKAAFLVDHYFVELNQLPIREIVWWSAYWYGVWSHRRNDVWKGFLQVDLNPAEDSTARLELDVLMKVGQTP